MSESISPIPITWLITQTFIPDDLFKNLAKLRKKPSEVPTWISCDIFIIQTKSDHINRMITIIGDIYLVIFSKCMGLWNAITLSSWLHLPVITLSGFQCNEKNIIFDQQNCSRGDAHRRGHEDRRSHRQRPLRRHRTPEVAIRRLEWWRHTRKPDGVRRTSGVIILVCRLEFLQ